MISIWVFGAYAVKVDFSRTVITRSFIYEINTNNERYRVLGSVFVAVQYLYVCMYIYMCMCVSLLCTFVHNMFERVFSILQIERICFLAKCVHST
jgi:hypothetical protein